MLFAGKPNAIARILLVEDEPLVAFDTEHLLSDQGFTVTATVDRVSDALAVLAAEPIDLVLADVNLADGSGLDVARAARMRGVPVLFVTGACPAEAEGLAAGCLGKPYSQRALLRAIAAIDAAIRGRPPGRLPTGFRLFATQADAAD